MLLFLSLIILTKNINILRWFFFFLNPIYSPFSRKIPENHSVKSLLWSLYCCKILHHTWLPFFCTLICQHFHFHGVSTFKYHLQVLVLSIEAISWVCDMIKYRKENFKHCRYIYLSAGGKRCRGIYQIWLLSNIYNAKKTDWRIHRLFIESES